LNYSTNINPEIAQYDINEMTNYIKTNNIKDKIARRAALTKRATQALMNAEYSSENRSLSLQNKMETSQSNYDKHLLNIAKIKLKQKLLEVNIQQCNMQNVKKNGNNALQRREITDYYKMNDKICEKKMNAYKHCTDSIVEDNFKAMKYLAVPNNCYPNRNVKRKNKLPFPVNNNNSKYKNK
jgi:predicted ATP-dependent protease